MPIKTKLIFGLGVALAPWLFTMPASAQDPPPDADGLAPTAIVQLSSPQIVGSSAFSWVDAKIGAYLLAATRLLQTGLGPASNPGIVVVDTTSLLVTNVLGSGTSSTTTPFAGACGNLGRPSPFEARFGFNGPTGVTIVKRGQGESLGNAEVWASDGPIVSPPCPIDPNTGSPNQFTGTISGNTLTVTVAPSYGTLKIGDTVVGLDASNTPNVAPHTTITGTASSNSGACTPSCTGTGTNTGTYAVSVAQSFPSEKMSAFNVTDPGARPSQVVVFDFKTGAISAIIPIKSGNTTGLYRANHLCYNETYGVVLIANDGDNFITFIDAKTYQIIQIIKFDGTDPDGNHIHSNGLEQCQFNPRDDNFYFNIPDSATGGHVVRISPKLTQPLQFHVEKDWNTADIKACAPGGLAVGPATQLALGCDGTNGLIISDGTGATPGGSTIVILPGGGGIGEDWYNPGNNHYYFANSGPGLLKAADAGNLGTTGCTGAGCPAADQPVPTGAGSGSVAADSVANKVFVPIRAGRGTVCGTFGGSTANGCIAVYQGTNDGDDIDAGKRP